MGGSSKFLAGLLAGAAAGAAVAVFLNSETGKKVMADVKDAASKAADQLKEKLAEILEQPDSAAAQEQT